MNRRTITKAVFVLLLVAGGIYACREASREAHRRATNPTIHEIRQAADRPGPRQAIAQAMLAFKYLNGEGIPQSNRAAALWFRKAAHNSHPEAQAVLGTMYYRGEGVQKDYQMAVFWIRKAAEQGHRRAQQILGAMYYNGDHVPNDYNLAAHWFRKAAAQGHTDAQVVLGMMYFRGQGVPHDVTQAQQWLNRAAAQGHKEAAEFRDALARLTPEQRRKVRTISGAWRMVEELGKLPDDIGERIRKTIEKIRAAPPLDQILDAGARKASQTTGQDKPNPEGVRQAAEAGDAAAQTTLGRMYYHGIAVPQSGREAARWLRSAAMQGHPPAQLDLGILYRDLTAPPAAPGLPPANEASNRIKAYAWMILAAETAQSRLAGRYPFTTYTRARDDHAAKMQRFEIPAARSHAAQLRSMIEDGFGTRPHKSMNWSSSLATLSLQELEQAARQGETAAAVTLARRYAYGQSGAPQDFIKAYTWALVSIHRGGRQATELLQWLDQHMPRYDRHQARELAERIWTGQAAQ